MVDQATAPVTRIIIANESSANVKPASCCAGASAPQGPCCFAATCPVCYRQFGAVEARSGPCVPVLERTRGRGRTVEICNTRRRDLCCQSVGCCSLLRAFRRPFRHLRRRWLMVTIGLALVRPRGRDAVDAAAAGPDPRPADRRRRQRQLAPTCWPSSAWQAPRRPRDSCQGGLIIDSSSSSSSRSRTSSSRIFSGCRPRGSTRPARGTSPHG